MRRRRFHRLGSFTIRAPDGRELTVLEHADTVRSGPEEWGVGERVRRFSTPDGREVVRRSRNVFEIVGEHIPCVLLGAHRDSQDPKPGLSTTSRADDSDPPQPTRSRQQVQPVPRDGWLTHEEFTTIRDMIGQPWVLRRHDVSRLEILAVTIHGVRVRVSRIQRAWTFGPWR